jgi:hypothetical protein
LTGAEIDEQIGAVRDRMGAGKAGSVLVVLLDVWRGMDAEHVPALLDRLADRAVEARVVYVTDDDTVLAWARRLRRWRGSLVDLLEPEASAKPRWRRPIPS